MYNDSRVDWEVKIHFTSVSCEDQSSRTTKSSPESPGSVRGKREEIAC